MGGVLILAILVVIAFVFLGIGLLLRNRSRLIQIIVTTSIAVTMFLFITLVGSGIGIGVYDFYHYEEVSPCQESTPNCNAQREQMQTFRANAPRLILWMTVPKPFRPPCETIWFEFCQMENSFDMAPYNYIAGAFGAVIVVFLIGQGMRQKDAEDVKLDSSLTTKNQ